MGRLLSAIIVVVFAVIAGFPLLYPGLPPTHDGEYHVVRFYLFNKSILNGNLYPRWASDLNNGFGAPLFNFVYPLPNYIASIFHTFSISFIDCFKLSMFFATIFGGIFFYLWTKEFWGKVGGVVSSAYYTFFPYHFVDIYIRGSVGEIWALAFFPAFLWSYTKYIRTSRNIYLFSSPIFMALTIFSHNILALMFFAFAIIYSVFFLMAEKKTKYFIKTLTIFLIGLGLSAIFWLPAIFETKYVVGLQVFNISAYFPQLYQLLVPSWGSGFSNGGLQNEMSYQIGIAYLFVIFLSFPIIILLMRRQNRNLSHLIFFLICFFLVLFLMLKISLPLWQIIPFMNYFQFPWRFLSLEMISTSFLAGSIFSLKIRNKLLKISIAIFLITVTFVSGIGYAKVAYYMSRSDNYYVTRPNFINGTNSPGNVFNTIYLKNVPEKVKDRLIFLKGTGKIKLENAKVDYYKFIVDSSKESVLQVNIAYFPGWTVKINSQNISISQTSNGLFKFPNSAGKNTIEIQFKNTLVREISKYISILSLLVAIIFLLKPKRFATIKK